MSDIIIAWIRTIVPAAVGLILAGLARLGIEIDSEALQVVVDGLFIGAWYLIARWLETVAPWIPWNGVRKTPTY